MSWQNLDPQTCPSLLTSLNQVETLYHFNSDDTGLSSQALDFYPGAHLLRVTLISWPATEDALWYVQTPDKKIINLNGKLSRIHQLNVNFPLKLSIETLKNYLKFRLFFELKHGFRSLIVEDMERFKHIRESDRKNILNLLTPFTFTQRAGLFSISYCYHLRDRIFQATATLDGNGLLTETTKKELPYSLKLINAPYF